jgi:hypothetical protein
MSTRYRLSILFLVFVLGVVLAQPGARTSAGSDQFGTVLPHEGPFSPSNARTESGELIPSDQFFPAERCAGCHRDSHHEWSESLHRNSGRAPFYKESVDILERQPLVSVKSVFTRRTPPKPAEL